jgi:hypothetical protein
LEPLRGSATIEKIDLSLVGDHETPLLHMDPPLSMEIVLPVLDSIVEREGNSLKYLLFPHVWLKERPIDPNFYRFISRYNVMFNDQHTIRCLECNTSLPDEEINFFISPDQDSQYFGTQHFTCSQCMMHYCYGCEIEEFPALSFCDKCKRDYCRVCQSMEYCDDCDEVHCSDCATSVGCSGSRFNFSDYTQSACTEKVTCSGCVSLHSCQRCKICFCRRCRYQLKICDSCTRRSCYWCIDEEGLNGVRICQHDHVRCGDCRLQIYRDGNSDCVGCCVIAAELLLEENNRLHRKVQILEAINERLRSKSK